MAKTNIIEIRKIAFTKMRKLEVYTFYNEVVTVIKEYDAKAMHIGDTCDVLMAMQPKSQLLRLTDRDCGPHQLTPVLDKLHEKRLKFAATITNQMRTLEKADIPNEREMVKLTKPIVYRYLNYLRQKDKDTIVSHISGFFYELRLQPEVKNALYQLGFKTYLDELEVANIEHEKTYNKRRGQLSRRPKGSTLPVQRELQNILSILFEQVDYYQHVYKDIDYSKLITALNHTIAVYTKLIKTRDTQRKNKKLKTIENEQAALEGKPRIGSVEKVQPEKDNSISAPSSIINVNEKQNYKPANTDKKKKGEGKPINGLMHILKKPNKGKKDGDEEDD